MRIVAPVSTKEVMDSIVDHVLVGTALGIEAASGLLVGLAAIQGTVQALASYRGSEQGAKLEDVRRRFGRWLMLALEFQVGADILRTAVAPSWNGIGQLAAIVVIRTVLNYFLARDVVSPVAPVKPAAADDS